HPLAADAYRWLVRFHASSEARRREELGQFLVLTSTDIRAASAPGRDDPVRAGFSAPDSRGLTEMTDRQQIVLLSSQAGARKWYRHFLAQPRGPLGKPGDDPWREAAAAELWLVERTGTPPKPVAPCKQAAAKPFLDGNLDDACWRDAAPLVLRDAAGGTAAA